MFRKMLLVSHNTLLSSAKTLEHLSLPNHSMDKGVMATFKMCKIFSQLMRQYGTNSKLEIKEF
jgi:hypothetical protein